MINDFITGIINAVDGFYTSLDISTHLSDLLDKLNKPFDYVADFGYYMSGVYFIFGKPLVIYFISVVAIIITIRIALAVVNLVYP